MNPQAAGKPGRRSVAYFEPVDRASHIFRTRFMDTAKNFVVFELKLGRGPDAALGQVQRYMGWFEHHVAMGKSVSGVIVANSISDKLKYAGKVAPRVQLMEYRLSVELAPVTLKGLAPGAPA